MRRDWKGLERNQAQPCMTSVLKPEQQVQCRIVTWHRGTSTVCQLRYHMYFIIDAHYTVRLARNCRCWNCKCTHAAVQYLAPLKLRPYGAIQICLLLLLYQRCYKLNLTDRGRYVTFTTNTDTYCQPKNRRVRLQKYVTKIQFCLSMI